MKLKRLLVEKADEEKKRVEQQGNTECIYILFTLTALYRYPP